MCTKFVPMVLTVSCSVIGTIPLNTIFGWPKRGPFLPQNPDNQSTRPGPPLYHRPKQGQVLKLLRRTLQFSNQGPRPLESGKGRA